MRPTLKQSGDLSNRLLDWYDRNRRDLPWRALPGKRPNPYHVWLSEIMLQQTTVTAVVPYFQRFIKRWPTIQSLAKAEHDDVLRLWAGLGYYRRARALHEAARKICREFGGRVPSTEEDLLSLPGCGSYTAAAVAAIAFDRRANVVDGNVERVVARLFAVAAPMPGARNRLRSLAGELLPKTRFGDYAQALMDLGAMVCKPRCAACGQCPLRKGCRAASAGEPEKWPRRRRRVKPVRRAIAFYLTNAKGRVLLRKRPSKGLLADMMEVPSSVWKEGAMPRLESVRHEAPVKARWKLAEGTIRHAFSHFDLEMGVAIASCSGRVPGRWVHPERMSREALPGVMKKVIAYAQKSRKDPKRGEQG